MDWIALENFRCFKDTGRVALRPLNLLVGENSSGKSSFLAAVRLAGQFLNGKFDGFNEEPFRLGSPRLVARKLGPDKHASSFGIRTGWGSGEAEIWAGWSLESSSHIPTISRAVVGFSDFEVTLSRGHEGTLEHLLQEDRNTPQASVGVLGISPLERIPIARLLDAIQQMPRLRKDPAGRGRMVDALLERLGRQTERWAKSDVRAFAPLRSRPERTYDFVTEPETPEGTHVPVLLADLARNRPAEWAKLRKSLERFGRDAGLFHSIHVEALGKHDAAPFQIELKFVSAREAAQNLVDVGYGVSQILPILVELLLARMEATHLVQQPEMHLHPQAQASFGSLLANLAAKNGPSHGRLLVETHSDHLMDRVRIDVRKGVLAPEAVQILYFERASPTEVRIHPIGIDEMGNLIDVPDGYRDFFLQEKMRFLGLDR